MDESTFCKTMKTFILSEMWLIKVKRLIVEYILPVSVGSVDVGAKGSAAHKEFSQLLQYLSETRNIEITPLDSTGKFIPKVNVPKVITTFCTLLF